MFNEPTPKRGNETVRLASYEHMTSPGAHAAVQPAVSENPARMPDFNFRNTYARLPERFYARLPPTPVAAPRLIKLNVELATFLGLHPAMLASHGGVQVLAGNLVAEGSEPLAIAYAGHQFGYFVPQLGDGRANLLGELLGKDGQRYDLQLKGSGPTPFSRRGDGRAALGPVLREYLVSEAMAALGVPTTRALAAVSTGDRVLRETAQPGAVLARVAASHLRVGTFEYFAVREDTDALRTLAEYAIARHYPDAGQAARPFGALLKAVIGRQAHLIAQWMLLGFIHGVMNTDNTAISGETLDYGPCAFMEGYDPMAVYSSIDQNGRYAYSNQSHTARWNLARLAESLLPLLELEQGSAAAALDAAKEALAAFDPQFEQAHLAGLRRKLGLRAEREEDQVLAEELLALMAAQGTDFTLTFRRLCDAAAHKDKERGARTLFPEPSAYDAWEQRWRQRLDYESLPGEERAADMRLANPMYIPRNHLVDSALRSAVERNDFAPFEALLEVTSQPYTERDGLDTYATPALPDQRILQTFCGT